MKILLGCLMCFVLTTSQAFAISGGPFGGRGGKVSTTGTYAGVMMFTKHVPLCCADSMGNSVPCSDQGAVPALCSTQTGTNQFGIFSVSIPKTALGTGPALLFDQGQIYTGTIQATADPDSAQVTGIFSASFPYIIIVTSTDSMGHTTQTPVTVIAQASGKLTAKVKASSRRFTTSSIRLTGHADVQFELNVNSPLDEIDFKVIGFKQANS